MEAIVSRSADIDIGRAVLKATVRVQGDHGRRTRREVRSFGTTTAQLLALRDWLVSEGVTLVGMESTGVFWRCGVSLHVDVSRDMVESLPETDERLFAVLGAGA